MAASGLRAERFRIVLFGEQFKGFDEAAFAAFEPRKWTSNLYNVERMGVREQLKTVGAAADAALRTRPFKWDVTPHAPCVFNGKRVAELVLYFTRTDGQQKALAPLLDSRIALPDQISDAGEHHRHATLGLRIDAAGVEVGLMLHSTAWLDVMNLLNRCRVPDEAGQLLGLLHGAPEGATFRIGPAEDVPARDVCREHLDRLEESVLNHTFLIVAGLRFGAGDERLRSIGFPGTVREVLAALLPLWEFVAWRPASDFLRPAAPNAVAAPVAAPASIAVVPELAHGRRVRLIDGAFAGREGVVTDLDQKGSVRVLIGKVNVRTDSRSVRAV